MFPVFSISTSAISIDGYDVSTRVVNESGVYEEFTNTIVFNASTNQLFITVDIEFPEVIPENTVFDLEVEFSIGDYLTISEYNGGGTMYDSNWVQLEGKLDGIVKDGKLSESQIVATGDVKYIRYVFDIYSPFWIVDNIGPSSFVSAWTLNKDVTYVRNYFNSGFAVSGKIGDVEFSRVQAINVGLWDEAIEFYLNNSNSAPYFRLHVSSYSVSGIRYYGFYFNEDGSITRVPYSNIESTESKWRYLEFYDEIPTSLREWLNANATEIVGDDIISQYSFDFAVTSISVTQEDDTGVIGGIFGWIKRIFSAISDIPNQIGNKLTAFGNWLIDQIKGLFVPSEETIIELKDKFEALLADRFGAAYQSIEVVEQFGQAMGISTYSDTVDTITFPSVTVPLAGTEFTFGGWEVDLVPKGFEGLITPLKLIVDLVCTIACVNMFRRRMEGVLR